jgi:TolB-like protein
MAADEARAIAVRDRHRALLRPIVERFHGELVETPGDEALVVFASSLRAVECALALQEAALRDADDLKLRIGIHVGDVLFRGGEVVGEGVNVAARIRALAEPGGICVSGAVYEHVKNHPRLRGRSLGSRSLKNVAQPIEVFALSADAGELPRARPRRAWLGLAAGAALLLAAGLLWLVGRPPPSAPAGHSLAVLPFVNLSADPEQEYFADGIAEELLNTVARFEGLRVIGRTSSFSFRNSDADLRTIGQALGADVILEGSVRTAGNRVRIAAQLVDAQDGIHRWSESYDRELGDIFGIQTEIATAIATALRVQLSPEQGDRLAAPTQNFQAYQAFLLGNQGLAKVTPASIGEGIRLLQQAIELDPNFALAHANLAIGYLELFELSDRPPGEMLARAQVAASKALELDEGLAEAHVAVGAGKYWRNDFEGAEAAFQRALTLNPNSVSANLLYGDLLGQSLARYEESLALRRKAVEVDPLSLETVPRLGDSLQWVGRFDESLSWYERSLEIDPDFAWGHELIGDHHWRVSGRLDEAMVWLVKAVALDPQAPTSAHVFSIWATPFRVDTGSTAPSSRLQETSTRTSPWGASNSIGAMRPLRWSTRARPSPSGLTKPSRFSGIRNSERATMPMPLRCTRSCFPSCCTSATLRSTSGTI